VERTTTIITLEPKIQPTTFEKILGEYSNANGSTVESLINNKRFSKKAPVKLTAKTSKLKGKLKNKLAAKVQAIRNNQVVQKGPPNLGVGGGAQPNQEEVSESKQEELQKDIQNAEDRGDVIGEEELIQKQNVENSLEVEQEGEEEEEQSEFEGVMGSEDRFSEMTNNSSVKISDDVQDVAVRIQFNKELISRLRIKIAKAMSEGRPVDELNEQVVTTQNRIMFLENILNQYQNFSGEFSPIEGKPTKEIIEVRCIEVKKAIGIAKDKRAQLKRYQNKMKNNSTPDVIEVPKLREGTGLNGMDNLNDYDAPPVREVKLAFDGSGNKKINWAGIAIGVGIGLMSIWAIRKYKLLNKI
jgi:hypothetical protein